MLFVFLFISWLGGGDSSASAWELWSVADLVLAALALTTLVIAGSRVLNVELPVQWLRPELLKWTGAIALTITLTLLIELSKGRFGGLSIEVGGYVSILACLAMLAGAILAERPDLAGRVADAAGIDVDRPAAQPPAGVGSSSYAPPGAAPTTTPAADPATAVQPATGAGAGAGTASGAGAGGGPPAGWYPDPQGQARLRYWDGTGWTEQTSA